MFLFVRLSPAWKSPFVIPTSPLQVSVGFWRERHESLKFAAVRGSPKPAVRGRSKPPSAAHPSRPFAGDRRCHLRLTQAHRSQEIDAAISGSHKPAVCGRSPPAVCGSPKPTVRGRSMTPSAAHTSRPFVGDRRCNPRLNQARSLREIDVAISGSPKPAVHGRLMPLITAHPSTPFTEDRRHRPRSPKPTIRGRTMLPSAAHPSRQIACL